ncbi:phosphonoacetaldehyde hydrolase [Insolitispirillum peregrinum]|uniref:phosphonoacetaldehyde hydrolase n=1 Tax=Insolitispirillum peregrinum TaxID=80876 RepID=UPI003619DD52
MLTEVRAVVFDWAGTLIDQGACAPVVALMAVFAREGVAVAPAEARLPMGVGKREHVEGLLGLPGVAARWHAAKGKAPTRADIDRLYAALEPALMAALPDHLDLIDGAAALLRDLRRWGIQAGSTTGYSRRAMEPVLDAAARQGLEVQAVVCAGDTPQGRPHGDQLAEVLRRLSIDEPHRCVKVDDTTSGIAEGAACGLWTVAVTLSGNAAGLDRAAVRAASPDLLLSCRRQAAAQFEACNPDYIIDSVADLLPVLEDIAHRLTHGERPVSVREMTG